MNTFTIDDDNNITAYASTEEANQSAAAGVIHFDSQAALAKVSANWPLSRLVNIWNSIPGHAPMKKFQDRNKAVARTWSAIQSEDLSLPVYIKPFNRPTLEAGAVITGSDFPIAELVVKAHGRLLENGGRTAEVTSIKFTFNDQTLLDRITKALSHAAELCGVKPDPF